MTMVSSGLIALAGTGTSGGLNQSVEVELGGSGSSAISMNDTIVRNLANVSSGAISLSNFYGKSNYWVDTISSFDGTYGGVDSSGNSYLFNSINEFIKVKSNGAIDWQKSYTDGTFTYSSSYSIAVDSQNNIYTLSSGTGSGVGFSNQLNKIDSSGNLLWQRRLSGGNVYFYIAPNLNASTLYVVGAGSSNTCQLLLIDTSTGANSSSAALSGSNATFVQVAASKINSTDFYTTGRYYYVNSLSQNKFRTTVSKYSGTTLQWQNYIGSDPYDTVVYGMSVDSNDNVYCCGQTNTASSPSYALGFVAKYNSSGTLLWQKTIANNGYSPSSAAGYALSCYADSSGNVLVTVYDDNGGTKGGLIKFDTSGNVVWSRLIAPSSGSCYLFLYNLGPTNIIYMAGDCTANVWKLQSDNSTTTTISTSPSVSYTNNSTFFVPSTSSMTAGAASLSVTTGSPPTNSSTSGSLSNTSETVATVFL